MFWLLAASFLLTMQPAGSYRHEPIERIAVSDDGKHFVGTLSGKRFVVWGVNYDHDSDGRLIEDYWQQEWNTVVEDFHEIRNLGCNVVRIHLQLSRFLKSRNEPDEEQLRCLAKLVKLAEELNLYLDITGLGCYHKQDIPSWYTELDEADRWDAQALFWKQVALTCRESPAVFCYDLMNEPVLSGEKKEADWLLGELAGKFFVQRINLELAGRSRDAVASAWLRRMIAPIRQVDDKTMITVGEIPWAQVFPGARSPFHSSEAGKLLDFVAVHFYPKSKEVDRSLKALSVYEIGKPLLIEEFFPLACSIEEANEFLLKASEYADGCVSFYWGKTANENIALGDLQSAILAAWLKNFVNARGDFESQGKK
jgi:hypothetical protein